LSGTPARMNNDAHEAVDFYLSMISGYSFYEMLYHARFTRVDSCVDVPGVGVEDVLARCKYAQYSHCDFGKGGELQTLTFGKSGGSQTLIYDKSAEAGLAAKTLRVESRRASQKLTTANLKAYKNPFAKLDLYHLKTSNPPISDGYMKAFQDACRIRGITNALKKQPKELQAKLKKCVTEHPAEWWQLSEQEWQTEWASAMKDAGLNRIPHYVPSISFLGATGNVA
jgi:hypothetical protein